MQKYNKKQEDCWNKFCDSSDQDWKDCWKKSALKLNFLMNELKRLGADKHDTYSCILDLHQDIDIPYHDEIDKENAGIPSILTNPT